MKKLPQAGYFLLDIHVAVTSSHKHYDSKVPTDMWKIYDFIHSINVTLHCVKLVYISYITQHCFTQ